MTPPDSAAVAHAGAPTSTITPRVLLRHAPLFAALAAGALGLAHLHYHAAYTLDDAYISFRYARNLARGAGLTWNPGEYVKGYSNTLYTMLMALPELIGRDPIGLSKLLGYAAFAAIALGGARSYARASGPAVRDRAVVFAALCAASTSLAVHCMNGLETGVYSALLFSGALQRVQEQETGRAPWSALPLSAAVLMRPEGILLVAALALHDLVWRSWRRRLRLQDLAFYLAPALVYGLELWLSSRYYGAALPNTYYAKTSPTHGLGDTARTLWQGAQAQLRTGSYLWRGLHGTGLGLLGLVLCAPALLSGPYRRRSWALAALIGAQLVFIARAGDDWAPAFRFGVPLLAPLFMLVADGLGTLAALARRHERLLGAVFAVALLAQIVPQQLLDSRTVDRERYVNAANKLLQGAFFASLAEPGITLSSFDVGGQGYGAGGFDVLDTAGLNTRETVSCRRNAARCARYAELIMPELVRVHANRARDAFVTKTVVRHAPYVTLDGGKYLLQRELVFPAQLPPWAAAHTAQPAAPGVQLTAADVPEALPSGAQARVTLYFQRKRGEPGPALAARRLSWQGPKGSVDAGATPSVLIHVNDSGAWREGELLADLTQLRAPGAPGRYTLVLHAQQLVPVAELEVLERAAAETRAQDALERAAAIGDVVQRLHALSRAAELSPLARDAYQQAVAHFAAQLQRQADAEHASDPVAALRTLQRAHRWLLRAYWECEHASSELRRALDDNGARRASVIAALLGPPAG